MLTFWTNVGFVLGTLVLFGACGWWAVAPFKDRFAFRLAQAPLAGLVFLTLATLTVSVVFHLRTGHALVAAGAICLGATVVTAAVDPDPISLRRHGLFVLASGVAAVLPAVWFLARADQFFDAPALLYSHGTDHLGYAHLADWLRLRPGNPPLTLTPADWYSSWPQYMLAHDPRFGSIAFLSIVSVLARRPGAFAYDLACAVTIAASVLGLAGTFSQRRTTFLVLGAGLLTSFWFDWSRTGYLGKINGYPATLFAVGLFFAWTGLHRGGTRVWIGIASLIGLACGAAVMFSGVVTGVLAALLGVLFLALRTRDRGRRASAEDLIPPVIALALVVILSVLSSGIVARPLYHGWVAHPWTWSEVMTRALEVESLLSGIPPLPGWVVAGIGVLTAVAWTSGAAYALHARRAEAASLLGGALLLLAGFCLADARWHAVQFVGAYLPLATCGMAVLVDAAASRWPQIALRGAFVAVVVLHLPRFASAASFYGGAATPAAYRFSLPETDRLAAVVERAGGAWVDIDNPQLSIFLLVELGRRGLSVHWSERSWRYVLGYRPWSPPTYPRPAPLAIVARSDANTGSPDVAARTTQFDVLRRADDRR